MKTAETIHPLLKSKGHKPRTGKVITCVICKNDFYRKPYSTITAKYCSFKCASEGKKIKDCKTTLKCLNCNKEFEDYKSYIKIRGRTFCSPMCQGDYVRKLANTNKDGSLPTSKTAKTRQIKKRRPGNAMRTADNLFSQYIRAKDKVCQKCGTDQKLQCSHIKSRAIKSIRYNEDNAMALCLRCHIYWWHKEPLEASQWMHDKFPGRYDRICKAQLEGSGKKIDYDAIKVDLHEKLKLIDQF